MNSGFDLLALSFAEDADAFSLRRVRLLAAVCCLLTFWLFGLLATFVVFALCVGETIRDMAGVAAGRMRSLVSASTARLSQASRELKENRKANQSLFRTADAMIERTAISCREAIFGCCRIIHACLTSKLIPSPVQLRG